jgi:hypothetical protein
MSSTATYYFQMNLGLVLMAERKWGPALQRFQLVIHLVENSVAEMETKVHSRGQYFFTFNIISTSNIDVSISISFLQIQYHFLNFIQH